MNGGIGMIHQHFTLIPTQTVTENILLGLDEPRFIDAAQAKYDKKMIEIGEQFGMKISPQTQNVATVRWANSNASKY